MKMIGQRRHRDTTIAGIRWRKRVKPFDIDGNRHGGVGQMHHPKGIRGIEGTFAEAGQAVMGDGRAIRPLVFVGFERTFEGQGKWFAMRGLDPYCQKRRIGAEFFGGAIADFPVAQIATATQCHGTGANAPQGQGNGAEVLLVIMADHGDFGA